MLFAKSQGEDFVGNFARVNLAYASCLGLGGPHLEIIGKFRRQRHDSDLQQPFEIMIRVECGEVNWMASLPTIRSAQAHVSC